MSFPRRAPAPRHPAAQRRAAVMAATLAMVVIGTQLVLRENDSVLGEMHPAGCPTATVGSLSARPWDRSSALEVAVAVETWHAHSLSPRDRADVQRVAPCAARLTPDAPADSGASSDRFASVRDVYQDGLRWRSLYGTPLIGLLLLSLAWAVRRQVTLALTVPVVVIGTVAMWVENIVLRQLLDRAWRSAQRFGTVDATRLDTTVVNIAGTIHWVCFGAVAALVGVLGFRPATAGIGRLVAASRGVRLHVIIAVAFAVAMLVVPQSSDAVRRWGAGQTVLSISLAFVLAAAVALAGSGDGPDAAPLPATHAGGWRRTARVLAPLAVAAAACWFAAAITERRGLLVPALLLAGLYLLSLPLGDSSPRAPTARPATDRVHRRRLLAGAAALGPIALGALMVRVGAADVIVLNDPTLLSRTLVVVGLALVGLGAVLTVGVHALMRRLDQLVASRPGRTLGGVAFIAALAIIPTAMLASPDGIAESGARFGSIAIFTLFLIDLALLVVLLRATATWLLSRPATAALALPPLLRHVGLERPPLVGLVVVWALFSTMLGPGEYHDVRVLATEGRAAQAAPSMSVGDAVDAWVARQDFVPGEALPAVVVAAAGGGLRSSYWTAAVLDCVIEGESVGRDPCAGRTSTETAARRRSRLLLMSGVSGGSLGLVSYVAAVGDGWTTGTPALTPRWYDSRLGADFQAPVLARMLFGDLPELFLRHGSGADRAVVLERALEQQWPDDALTQGFLAEQAAGEPLLVLSGLVADDGCRFNASILSGNGDRRAADCRQLTDPAGTQLLATTDLGDFLCADTDVRRSTAALLSARFPYISPSGRLVSGRCHGTAASAAHVIDGGYRESAGASPVAELLPALHTALTSHPTLVDAQVCAVPVFVQLDSAGATDDEAGTVAGDPNEATLPLVAVNRARDGVEMAARAATFAGFTGPVTTGSRTGDVTVVDPRSPAGDTLTRWFRIAPSQRPGGEAPLGWSLADTTRADLQHDLSSTRGTIELLRSILDGNSLRCDARGGVPADSDTDSPAAGRDPSPAVAPRPATPRSGD